MPNTKKTQPATRVPKCRKCGSTDITVTSSQQTRMIRGEKRLVADAVCGQCGHTWWSANATIRKAARRVDQARKANATVTPAE
jgi:hypothetical protein